MLANFDADVYFRKTVVQKCTFLSFSFRECADTSCNDLEPESGWEPLPKAFTVQAR